VTAHNWNAVDVIGSLVNPTECFYSKDGKWYYAGTYQAVRLQDLIPEEWNNLSNEVGYRYPPQFGMTEIPSRLCRLSSRRLSLGARTSQPRTPMRPISFMV
jgi:hypothetical protein